MEGMETYLSDAYVARRDSNQPNLFLYGTDTRTKRSIVEVHTNGFDNDDDENDDDDDDVLKNTRWLIDSKYHIIAIVFDDNSKQIFMAVEHDESTTIYRIGVREKVVSYEFLLTI
jgi:hypothetical protein